MPKGRAISPADPLCSSDVEIYPASSTEEEDYSCAEDQEWEVEMVHGVEIDSQRKRRYEVQWRDWKRRDGSSTTWEHLLGDDNKDVREGFDLKFRKKAKELAKGSGSITLENIFAYLPHVIRTAEAYEGYEEKLELWRSKQSQCNWDTEIVDTRKRHLSQKRKRGTSVSSSDTHITCNNSAAPAPSTKISFKREQSATSSSTLVDSPFAASVRSRLRPKDKGKSKEINSSAILALENAWSEKAKAAGAEIIQLVNEVDNEECPRLSDDFRYLEAEYLFAKKVKRPPSAFMCGCSCTDDCKGLLSCLCQSETDARDEESEIRRAYDDAGRFLFNSCFEVLECNENCSCSERCKNRVAQKPRDIPLQVFKTRTNGWGVRSRERIPKGKVLGLYTGEIITRQDSEELGSPEVTYLFDLDARDGDTSRNLALYTIDATNCGNWTRFMNHSCDPVAAVYSVVYNIPQQSNMPYLAVAAKQDIEPFTEITIDYNPSVTTAEIQSSQEKKEPGLVVCKCGSYNCRGWLFTKNTAK